MSKSVNLFVAIGLGLLGLGSGWYGARVLMQPEAIIVESTPAEKELSPEEIEALCASDEPEKQDILEIQAEVKTLQQQLQERETELQRLKKDAKSTAKASAAARKKWKAMEADIAQLQIQLAAAEHERDELKVELKKTLVELDKQVKETKKYKAKAKKYKRQSTQNLWSAFRSQSKVVGCNPRFLATKKSNENCHTAFDEALSKARHDRFTECVDTYQAVPVLKKLKRGQKLPSFSERLEGSRYTKNWYIIFCDPTLPEKRDVDLDDAAAKETSDKNSTRKSSSYEDEDELEINFDVLPEN